MASENLADIAQRNHINEENLNHKIWDGEGEVHACNNTSRRNTRCANKRKTTACKINGTNGASVGLQTVPVPLLTVPKHEQMKFGNLSLVEVLRVYATEYNRIQLHVRVHSCTAGWRSACSCQWK